LPSVHTVGLAHVQLMAREKPVSHERLSVLEGLTMCEPQLECVSAQLKGVAILYEAAC
jgi:hypothetical protein